MTTTLPPRGPAGPGFFTSIEQAQEARAVAEASARRTKLLRWSAPVVAVVTLAAVFLLTITVVVIVGQRSYAAQSYPSAVRQFGALQSVNAVETWKPAFNTGTAEYSSGRFFAATQELEHAMTLVPLGTPQERSAEECLVATNLSLAYEGLGDEAARASDAAMAIAYYDQALATIEGCGTSGGGGGSQEQQESADEAQERQEEKQQEQGGGGEEPSGEPSQDPSGDPSQEPSDNPSGDPSQQPSQDPSGEPSGGASPTPDPSGSPTPSSSGSPSPSNGSSGEPSETSTLSEQQRELEERNRDAQEQRDREQQEQGGGSGNGQSW